MAIAKWPHLFPSRTQKLSTSAADIAFGEVCTLPGRKEETSPLFFVPLQHEYALNKYRDDQIMGLKEIVQQGRLITMIQQLLYLCLARSCFILFLWIINENINDFEK